MNRRDLLKAAMVTPIVGASAIKTMKGTQTKPIVNNPDWRKVITNQDFNTYTKSICNVLKAYFNNVSCEWPGDSWDECGSPDQANFWGDDEYLFSIFEQEFEKNNEKNRKWIVEIRWIDYLWSLNDNINSKINFIQQFDPAYNPENYKKD